MLWIQILIGTEKNGKVTAVAYLVVQANQNSAQEEFGIYNEDNAGLLFENLRYLPKFWIHLIDAQKFTLYRIFFLNRSQKFLILL